MEADDLRKAAPLHHHQAQCLLVEGVWASAGDESLPSWEKRSPWTHDSIVFPVFVYAAE